MDGPHLQQGFRGRGANQQAVAYGAQGTRGATASLVGDQRGAGLQVPRAGIPKLTGQLGSDQRLFGGCDIKSHLDSLLLYRIDYTFLNIYIYLYSLIFKISRDNVNTRDSLNN